ncbi:hypothetical protein [Bradyrhizobium sp. CER78]|uniref:hypothetical protein n=1 Tax=Bradyrhizobium sp. CER78 TaxID=3039162 RepID=UPI00244D4B40|nr:hypothetical protein [Bradyrhizobium sp. CER78]MDH2385231.1 hypothetical protein [Bradyrhizobium sp. CER78]
MADDSPITAVRRVMDSAWKQAGEAPFARGRDTHRFLCEPMAQFPRSPARLMRTIRAPHSSDAGSWFSAQSKEVVMTTTNAFKIIPIATGNDAPKLSRSQKTFNALILQIEQQRALLRAWEELDGSYQQKYHEALLPLQTRRAELQLKMARCLDSAWRDKGLGKSEKRTISDIVTDLVGGLLADTEEQERIELTEIYNRHSGTDFATEAAAELDDMKAITEALFGVKTGDDVKSSDDLMQRIQESLKNDARLHDEAASREEERQARRKKSPRQLAAEARVQTEQAELSRSIREVYHKLVVALHPDREPEPRERERKTELMQRANAAYKQKDLLQLLELQLELEHIDQHDINGLSEERLKRYNTILREQLGELKAEINDVELAFRIRFDIDPFGAITPAGVMRRLDGDVGECRRHIREIERDLRVLDDPNTLRMWLKNIKRARARSRFDRDEWF